MCVLLFFFWGGGEGRGGGGLFSLRYVVIQTVCVFCALSPSDFGTTENNDNNKTVKKKSCKHEHQRQSY